MGNEMKANCKYYLKNKEDERHVFEHGYLGPCCALQSCKNNDGKFLVEDAYVGACITNRFIENGIPVDKNEEVINLESEVKSRRYRDNIKNSNDCFHGRSDKRYAGIKPTDPKKILSCSD